jgi:nucleotide-binding universal stress UspA family protein
MNTFEITPGALVAAVDGSAHALQAAQWAADQARLEGRSLTLVHVTGQEGVKPTTLRTVGHDNDFAWVDDSLRASHLILQEATDAVLTVAPTVHVHGLSIPGEPRQVLSAISGDAHLLVLGSRGRGAVRSKLFGSVSAHVAKATRCPLVVVRPGSPGALKDGVLVTADATAESRPVLEYAFHQASLDRLPLTVLHCLHDIAATATGRAGGYVRVQPDTEQRAEELAESLAGLGEKYPDVHVTHLMMHGSVADCVAAHPRPWNLVVLGRHPVHGLDRLTGSTAVQVMERSTSPIAVVPEAAPTS